MSPAMPEAAATPAAELLADVGLVLAAAGSSRRFGGGRNKLLEPLAGHPLFWHSLARFAPCLPPGHLVLVVAAGERASFEAVLRESGWHGRATVVEGGEERQHSVLNGLLALPATARLAAIHDAARPYASIELLRRCVEAARHGGSGVAATTVRDTIKVVDHHDRVLHTPPRATLRAAETPQVFDRELLIRAYRQALADGAQVTDDAQAVERLGHPVQLVVHTADNRKITFAADLP